MAEEIVYGFQKTAILPPSDGYGRNIGLYDTDDTGIHPYRYRHFIDTNSDDVSWNGMNSVVTGVRIVS